MKGFIVGFILFFSVPGFADDKPFTGWMIRVDLDNYLEVLNEGDQNKNYFEKGHRISAVEGRWSRGRVEYRVKIVDIPKNEVHPWFWWVNQSYESFVQKMKKYERQGFALIYAQSFLLPDGTSCYQGVWHKNQNRR